MDDLTPYQVRILELLEELGGQWVATDLCEKLGIRAAGCGVALKGLYKRRLVLRHRPDPHSGAKYEITEAGREVLSLIKASDGRQQVVQGGAASAPPSGSGPKQQD